MFFYFQLLEWLMSSLVFVNYLHLSRQKDELTKIALLHSSSRLIFPVILSFFILPVINFTLGQKYLQDLINADLSQHNGKLGIATEGLLWLKRCVAGVIILWCNSTIVKKY